MKFTKIKISYQLLTKNVGWNILWKIVRKEIYRHAELINYSLIKWDIVVSYIHQLFRNLKECSKLTTDKYGIYTIF